MMLFWKLVDVVLCSSRYAVEEERINLQDEGQRRRLERLSVSLQLFQAPECRLPDEISLPEKDAPIFLAAVESRANYLVTGDVRHFGPYFGKKIEGVTILLPAAYVRRRCKRE